MSKGKGIFGGKDDEGDDVGGIAPAPTASPARSTTAATTGATATPPTSKDGQELNAAGQPVDAKSPPLGEQDVVAPAPVNRTAIVEGEREAWGERPSLADLDNVQTVEVRTADPKLKRAYVAGIEFGPEPRTVSLAGLRALSKSHVAAIASDPSIEVRIADGKADGK